MPNSKRAKPAVIRHKEYGSKYRIIRTMGIRNTDSGTTDLYWVMRGINEDGSEHKGTTMLSCDSWATGLWEVAP